MKKLLRYRSVAVAPWLLGMLVACANGPLAPLEPVPGNGPGGKPMPTSTDIATGLPARDESWMMVEAASQETRPGQRPARLVVSAGQANTEELDLTKARTNIGREVDVYRQKGLHRRNDLAFVEDTEINRTVSREHAHIQYDRATGEHRLFSDRWYQRGGYFDVYALAFSPESPAENDPTAMENPAFC